MLNISGIFPPLPSSFDVNEDLLGTMMEDNIRKLCKYNLAGILVLGSNGELVMLDKQEKRTVYKLARKVIPSGKLMIAGTGSQSARETIELSNIAADEGADAVLVLNPSYYKGQMSTEVLVRFYHDVADSSAAPVIIYNMPANSGLDMDAHTVLAISKHDNIIGIKDSGGNLIKMAGIIKNAKKGFQVLAGSASFLLPALSLGAVGGILALANIAPDICLDIYNSYRNGNIEDARISQLNIVELNTAVTRKGGVPALKSAMDYLGMYGGPVRRPLLPIGEDERKSLQKLIDITLKK